MPKGTGVLLFILLAFSVQKERDISSTTIGTKSVYTSVAVTVYKFCHVGQEIMWMREKEHR